MKKSSQEIDEIELQCNKLKELWKVSVNLFINAANVF